MRAIAQGPDNFKITAAPILIPDGDWETDPKGNVCSAKGFKVDLPGLKRSKVADRI